jgi:hypothetical protein
MLILFGHGVLVAGNTFLADTTPPSFLRSTNSRTSSTLISARELEATRNTQNRTSTFSLVTTAS